MVCTYVHSYEEEIDLSLVPGRIREGREQRQVLWEAKKLDPYFYEMEMYTRIKQSSTKY